MRIAPFVFVLFAACSGDGSDKTTPTSSDTDADADADTDTDTGQVPVAIVGTPTVSEPAEAEQHLVRLLSLSTNVPASAALVFDDGDSVRDVVFPVDERSTEHELPLLGLRSDTTYDVTVTVTAEDGSTAGSTVAVVVPPLSILVPDVSLRAGSAADAEPGYTLMAAWAPAVADRLLAVDHEGNVVWAYETRGDPKSAMLWPDGRLSAVVAKNLSVRTMAGESLALYSDNPIKGAIALPDELHHDAYFPGDSRARA